MNDFERFLKKARELSWQNFGKRITFYHPGMFCNEGKWGKYAAISLSGKACELQCDHCQGKLLESMIFALTPQDLIKECKKIKERGDQGCLITAGLQKDGTIPWETFIPSLRTIKKTTNLFVSIHSGMVDIKTAIKLKKAGVDQVLIDVIGDDETLKKIYHVNFGVEKIITSLEALKKARIPIVPHIVVGLNYGRICGEFKAIQIISKYMPDSVVIVSLMPLPGTPMENISPPPAEKIAEIIATTRMVLPQTPIALGCARERGNLDIERLAIECGVNRIVLPSQEAMKKAMEYNLEISFKETCCSVADDSIQTVDALSNK